MFNARILFIRSCDKKTRAEKEKIQIVIDGVIKQEITIEEMRKITDKNGTAVIYSTL